MFRFQTYIYKLRHLMNSDFAHSAYVRSLINFLKFVQILMRFEYSDNLKHGKWVRVCINGRIASVKD